MPESDEYPIERVAKWCPDPRHSGARDYEGWAFVRAAPTPGLEPAIDDQGRRVQRCTGCIDRDERERAQRERAMRDPRPPVTELAPPARALEWWEEG